MFVRVVEISGEGTWRVSAGEELSTWPDATAALAHARSLAPDWIEVGEIRDGRHTWKTLRRTPGGDYRESALRWGGGS